VTIFKDKLVNISQQECYRVSGNIFRRWKVCLEAGGQHFEIFHKIRYSTLQGKNKLNSLAADAGFICNCTSATVVLRDIINLPSFITKL
jgi:hypothetical protein